MVLVFAAALSAQDSGDAPAPYPQKEAWYTFATWGTSAPVLGATCTDDTQNPVAGGFGADSDDGVVGSPLWNPVADDNQLTVRVGAASPGYLTMWVDANDDGTWDVSERYRYSTIYVPAGADYTFTDIRLMRPQGFSRNGANKVAVRIEIQESFGGPPNLSPSGYMWVGEVEDWLIDCSAPAFTVSTLSFRDGAEGKPVNTLVKAAGGVQPYTWQHIGGTLPAGVTLTQSGDDFLLSGTPGAGAGAGSPLYTFTVGVTDATAQTAQRTLEFRVMALPVAAPFVDTFSTATGWVLGPTWSHAATVAYQGQGVHYLGGICSEPGTDSTQGNNDNMILADSLGGPFTHNQFVPFTWWAVSPIVDCSALTTVQLRFKRWASTQMGDEYNGADRLRVQATADGSTWVNLWSSASESAQGALVDMAWTLRVFDITSIAAGQARVQVRFGVGPSIDNTIANPWIATIPDDFAGWCIDDLSIAATPVDALAVAGFTLQSPISFMHPDNSVVYPVGMRNYPHTFSVLVGNQLSQDVLLDACEVGVTWPLQPGTSHILTTNFHNGHKSWYDAGTWSLNAPHTLTAGQGGLTVLGTLQCSGLDPALNLAFVVMRCTLYLRGTVIGTGESFESTTTMDCVFDPAPFGLHVHEAPPGSTAGAEILANSNASGLRDFGSVSVPGGVSNWVNIICQTDSSNPFNVYPPTLTGPDASQFELYLPTPWVSQPVPQQNNCYFSVRFKPTSIGPKSCWIEFTHTAINAPSPFIFEVIGTGVGAAPVIAVLETDPNTGNPVGNGATATGQRDFGQLDITSATGLTRDFYVRNNGTLDLNLGTPAFATGGSGAFTLDLSQYSQTVTPGQYTTISITFLPGTLGSHNAWLEFSHNDTGTTTPFTFEVKGEGVITAPTIEVRLGGPFGPVVASGAPAAGMTHFGVIQVGTGPTAALTVFVRNLGQQPLDLSAASLAGTHAPDFTLAGTAPVTLTAGQSATFDLAFDPRAKGPKQAQFELTHNDTAAPTPFTIPLAGHASDPAGVTFTTAGVLTPGKVGSAYAMQFAAIGGTQPYAFTQVSGALPVGISLASDGTLSGTPTGAYGVFLFRVKVIDALQGEEERQFELAIQPPPGTTESKPGSAGGCAAGGASGIGALIALLAAAIAARRRKHSKTIA